jgi:glycosyltransferase involved in cell wall biosynthesis
VKRVAFVGSGLPHKGILVFDEITAGFVGSGVEFVVLGGGDPEVLRRLRKLSGVRVRGYYREGSLPCLLVRQHIDLALLLSIVPESYSLTLSECQAAGVPVIAFDHGALGERLRTEGGGLVVALASGASGVVSAIEAMGREGSRAPTTRALRTPEDEDRDWRQLYASVLAEGPSSPSGA